MAFAGLCNALTVRETHTNINPNLSFPIELEDFLKGSDVPANAWCSLKATHRGRAAGEGSHLTDGKCQGFNRVSAGLGGDL